MIQKLYNLISIVAVLILIFLLFRTCEKKENAEKINEASKDSLTIFRDKLGLEHAKISVLEGSNSDLKKLNSTKDSTLRKLQTLVDKNTTSAIVFNNTTTNKGKGKTTITFPKDKPGEHHVTFNEDTIIAPFESQEPCPTPTYSTTVDEKWFKGNIVANADSIVWNLKTFNEYQITEKRERERFWKEKTLKIEIKNMNPNTETENLKAWVNKKPKIRRGFIFGVGVIAGSAGTIFGVKTLNNLTK